MCPSFWVLSPEICIIVDRRKKNAKDKRQRIGGKADAVIEVEGSRPEYVKASAGVTTGVEEQGMSSRG